MSDDPRAEPFPWRPGRDAGAPSRSIAAILPSGRVLWLDVGPAPATAASLAHLARRAAGNSRRRRLALHRHRFRLALLSRFSAEAARRLARTKLARSHAFRRRLAQRTHALDRRLSRARETLRKRRDAQRHVQQESIRRIARRDLWDKAVLASSLPLFAAYGTRGRPFAEGNLALALNTLLWLVGDDVVDAVFGPEEPSPYAANDPDIWSYVAPFGNLLGGHWLLRDFQHERFVTGTVSVPTDSFAVTGGPDLLFEYAVAVRLDRLVGTARFPDLETQEVVPAVATVRSLHFAAEDKLDAKRVLGTSARVIGGTLVVFLHATATDAGLPAGPVPGLLRSVEIAWMIDTAPRARG